MLPFNYLVPAMFFNATVEKTVSLGSPSSGGALGLTKFVSGTLQSEPGFSPKFTATLQAGTNWAARDPSSNLSRITHTSLVVPNDGSLPFEMQATGIQIGSPEVLSIVAGTGPGDAIPFGGIYSVWLPTFNGGNGSYAALQNSLFVASEALSASDVPGQFFIALKISQIFCTSTNVTLGDSEVSR